MAIGLSRFSASETCSTLPHSSANPCCAWLQVAVSSAAFAAAHLSGPDFVPLTVLGGVLGAVLRAAQGNVLAPTYAHALYNAAIMLAIAADAST